MQEDVLELELPIACPPAEVRAWWTEFPPEYAALDPAEQPYRIRTLERVEDRVEVATHWRGPGGREVVARETLHLDGADSWSADVHMKGFSIHVDYHAQPHGNGTLLRIRSSIIPVSSLSTLVRPLVVERLKRQLEDAFRTAARLCEQQHR